MGTMLGPIAKALVLAACLQATGCCGPKLEDVASAHRTKIESQLAPLKSIHEQMMRLPKLEQDTLQHAGAPLVLDLRSRPEGANVALCHAEDLLNPEEFGYVPTRISWSGLLNRCASVLRRGHEVFDPAHPTSYLVVPAGSSAESLFNACEEVRYLAVVRTIDFVEPTFPSAPDGGVIPDLTCSGPSVASANPIPPSSAERRQVFLGGLTRAEVHLFELSTARHEGGFRIEARSSTKLAGDNSAADFKTRFHEALSAGVLRHVPGTKVRIEG